MPSLPTRSRGTGPRCREEAACQPRPKVALMHSCTAVAVCCFPISPYRARGLGPPRKCDLPVPSQRATSWTSLHASPAALISAANLGQPVRMRPPPVDTEKAQQTNCQPRSDAQANDSYTWQSPQTAGIVGTTAGCTCTAPARDSIRYQCCGRDPFSATKVISGYKQMGVSLGCQTLRSAAQANISRAVDGGVSPRHDVWGSPCITASRRG